MDPVISFYKSVPDLAKERWSYLDPAGAKGMGMTHNSVDSGDLCQRFDEGRLDNCFIRINSSLSFASPLPPSVQFIGPWVAPQKIVQLIKEHQRVAASSNLSVNAPAYESFSVNRKGAPEMEGGYNTKQPLPQPSRSPIPSLTPVKPTGWGDDITTPEADTYQGYGYNHDNRTVSIEVPTDDKSTQEWSQTPWVKGLPPGLNEAAVDLTPSTHQSSGSYSSGAKATTEMSRWESSPPLTEATPPSPFDVHEGKMGGSRGTGGGRSVDGGETKVAPIILPLEDRLFKAGSTSEGSWPKWYYMDQQDPTKEIYGPFDAPMMIALYKGMNCLGPTIFLLGIDPSVSLDSSPPPKSLFRPLPQLERLCLSDGEGAYEGFRCYTPIDEYRLKEAKARSPLLGREPPAEVFAAFMDQQNDDSSYDRDQGETVRVRGDSGYEGNGELDGPREEDQIVLPVQDEVRANEDVGEVGKDWVKEWGA